ncbi:hypothetical protein WAB17_05280 [Parerythrobacter aurantius]|uniref:hypothetical protein n=1 Tax=Parerythrobacter aurantius TaxID=3127706 RepID=UPI003254CA0C
MAIGPAMNPLLFLASLVAILALAGLAHWLRLGAPPRLATDADARAAAAEAVDGFEATRIGLDRNGTSALLHDSDGRVLLLKPHGNFFAGRLLNASSHTERWIDQGRTCLRIVSGEKRFGSVTLEVDDPDRWVAAIDALGSVDRA